MQGIVAVIAGPCPAQVGRPCRSRRVYYLFIPPFISGEQGELMATRPVPTILSWLPWTPVPRVFGKGGEDQVTSEVAFILGILPE